MPTDDDNPMIRNLTVQQLLTTLNTVFAPRPDERALTIFTERSRSLSARPTPMSVPLVPSDETK